MTTTTPAAPTTPPAPSLNRAVLRRPARRAATAVGLVLAALVGVLIWGVAKGPAVERAFGKSPLDGKAAPALSGPTLDGQSADLGRLKGNWVVVNFFATWCPPCIAEHPELVNFAESNATANRKVVSVVFDDVPTIVADFFERKGGDWPVLLDDGGAAVDWAVSRIPESIIVDPNGIVRGKVKGGVRADVLNRLIDEAESAEAEAEAEVGTNGSDGGKK